VSASGERRSLRATVCELPHEPAALEKAWAALCRHTMEQTSELVLLPELAFVEAVWEQAQPDVERLAEIEQLSEQWMLRLSELGAPAVVGARPRRQGTGTCIESFLWTNDDGAPTPLRRKHFLPDDPGAWEARWFTRGEPEFPKFETLGLTFGVNICTELWALETFGGYAAAGGVQAILSPRSTAAATIDKWLAAGRVAAVRSGAYSLSSNRVDPAGNCGGVAWVIDPDGRILATTGADEPFATVDLDLAAPAAARATYPRSVF
jgi:predicted amidohydrolase